MTQITYNWGNTVVGTATLGTATTVFNTTNVDYWTGYNTAPIYTIGSNVPYYNYGVDSDLFNITAKSQQDSDLAKFKMLWQEAGE